jgi:hypothetical protein
MKITLPKKQKSDRMEIKKIPNSKLISRNLGLIL